MEIESAWDQRSSRTPDQIRVHAVRCDEDRTKKRKGHLMLAASPAFGRYAFGLNGCM